VELQQAKQTQQDLNSQARIIYLKFFLAVAGVAGGVSVAMLVGRAVIAKNARK
jgi:hypothetical protein